MTNMSTEALQYIGLSKYDTKRNEMLKEWNTKNPNLSINVEMPWCAWFVSYVAKAVNSMLKCSLSCGELARLNGINSKKDYKPCVNDVVIYSLNKPHDHCGIVIAVYANEIVVVEGNKSNMVGFRRIHYNASCIYGYINLTENRVNEYRRIAKECILGLHGNGQERKKNIKALGYDYNVIQSYVNKLLKE